MPRSYKRDPGSRRYRDYTEETLLKALQEYRTKAVSLKDVSKIYNIPIRTLRNKIKGVHSKPPGRPQALTPDYEETLARHLVTCADYGMPLESNDIRYMVKAALDSKGEKTVKQFKNNLPGYDWVKGFLTRQKNILSLRLCQNIKRSRAEVGPQTLQKYFKNLEKSLNGVPDCNIVNFDETNLSDDPGQKRCFFKRGVKYPERIINFSKSNISVMFAGTASGELLPPYVIYKSEKLWDTWCEGGPAGIRYGRSKSGWMDMTNFDEWFMTILVPWARRKSRKIVIIGDNLSSHLSDSVIEKCEELGIDFVLLPANSTDKCQPLDVSFFAPLKRAWRKELEEHRRKFPSSTSLDKPLFPRMLKRLLDSISERIPQNLKAGFRACGICPLDATQVLKKFPDELKPDMS